MITKWIINKPDENAVSQLSLKGGISRLAAKALVSAGIDTMEKAVDFFGQQEGEDVYSDPFLIRDMEKACDIINEAVSNGDLICVYGDYDCDGITASAVLSSYLRDIGGEVITHINEREQGYGMNTEAVNDLAEKGVQLIVTVDNGISAVEEAKLCKDLGITLVITDHHQQGDVLPDAAAVVDPHRRDCPSLYKDFCGCGLVLKLICAMEGGGMDSIIEQYSDLVAIATVADIVPLTGENREIVRRGLHYLENTENIGLAALMEKAGLKAPYTSAAAAFGLAPRINAAGRIGSPMDAYRLLTEEDEEAAEELAGKVCNLNSKRHEFEEQISADIGAQIAENPALLDKRVLVFCGHGWHHGVIGIAAARTLEKYGKPVFLMSSDNEGEEFRGSARSIDGFHVFKAMSSAAELLIRFGGHSKAGGFSIDEKNIAAFDEKLQQFAHELAAEGVNVRQSVTVSGAVTLSELTLESVSGLDILEPFGECNPRPVFLLSDCVIADVVPLSNGAHTKLMLSDGKNTVPGLMFSVKTAEFPYRKGSEVNLLVSPELNTYNNRTSVSLHIKDIRLKGLSQQKLTAAEDAYLALRIGEKTDSRLLPRITPCREDLAIVYRALGKDRLSPFGLYGRLGAQAMNYCKFLLCLDIFREAGLVEYDLAAGIIKAVQGAAKADTENTPTAARLRKLAAQYA